MIRYYIVATIIVVVFGSIVFALRRTGPELKISAQATGTPTVEMRMPHTRATPRDFMGQGPWVLSALPGCFDEQSRVRGRYAELQAKVPPPDDRIAPGTTLRSGDCTLVVGARDVIVERGSDRLRVPPEAALYRIGGRLTLTARSGRDIEIRRY